MDPFLESIKTHFMEGLEPCRLELDAEKLFKAMQLSSSYRQLRHGARAATDFERDFWKSSAQASNENERKERPLEEHESDFYGELLGGSGPRVDVEKLYPERIGSDRDDELFSGFDEGVWGSGDEEETLDSFRVEMEKEGSGEGREEDEEDEEENEEDDADTTDEEEGDLDIEDEGGERAAPAAKEEKMKYRFESGGGQPSDDVLIKDPTAFLQPISTPAAPKAASSTEEVAEEEANIDDYVTQLHQSIFDMEKDLDIDYGNLSHLKAMLQEMEPEEASGSKGSRTSKGSGKTSEANSPNPGPFKIDSRVLKISSVGPKPSPPSQKKVEGAPKKNEEFDDDFLTGFALKKK